MKSNLITPLIALVVFFISAFIVPLEFLRSRIQDSLRKRGYDSSEPWQKHAKELPLVLVAAIVLFFGIIISGVYGFMFMVAPELFPGSAGSFEAMAADIKPVALALLGLAFFVGWLSKNYGTTHRSQSTVTQPTNNAKPKVTPGEWAVQFGEEKFVKASDEEFLIYPKNRWLWLLEATASLGWFCLIIVGLFIDPDGPIPIGVILSLPVFGFLGYMPLRRFLDSRPLLTINRLGITVYEFKQRFVKWDDVLQYEVLSMGWKAYQLRIRVNTRRLLTVSQEMCPIPLERVEEMMRLMSGR